MQPLVIDTNIVLDLLVFRDPAAAPLSEALGARRLAWLATDAMREELARVLGYPHLAARLARDGGSAEGVLALFDDWSQRVEAAPRAMFVCGDADDQKFIDLAVTHAAMLISKDREVLRMARRLARLRVATVRAWAPTPGAPA